MIEKVVEKEKLDNFYLQMLEEWAIDPDKFGYGKAQELGIQCAILHYLQSIDSSLKRMENSLKKREADGMGWDGF